MKTHARAFLWWIMLLLAACSSGHDDEDTLAARAHIALAAQAPGVTPFIHTLTLDLAQFDALTSIAYTIEPRPGTRSKPVAVTYERAWLERRNAYAAAARRLALPVFGLYAGYHNVVTITATFGDGSIHRQQVPVDTPAYSAADAFYDAPAVQAARSGAALPGLDFIELHNILGPPVVIDSDGHLRWAGAGLSNSVSTLFSGGGFFVGDPRAPVLYRLEPDGALNAAPIPAQLGGSAATTTLTNFHHDLAPGKTGLLAEMDGVTNGVASIGTILIELGPDGQVLRQWDMARILRDHMLANGDDPTDFVRDGADWFHMNSAIYDRAADALYVSGREHFVVKLDYESGRIAWLLGDTSKDWYLNYPSLRALALTVSDGNPPIGQHSLSITAGGNLLLFNNGAPSFNAPPGAPAGATLPYSAPVEYRIDDAARSAQVAWTHEHDRNIVSDICSSVFDAGTGHVLVTYSAAADRTQLRLAGIDRAGNTGFEYAYPSINCTAAFLARPIAFDALQLR